MGGEVEDGKGVGGETEGGLRVGWQNSNNTRPITMETVNRGR